MASSFSTLDEHLDCGVTHLVSLGHEGRVEHYPVAVKAAPCLHRIRQEMRLGEANRAGFAIPN